MKYKRLFTLIILALFSVSLHAQIIHNHEHLKFSKVALVDTVKADQDPVWSKHYSRAKDPVAATLLSFVIPAGGQIYNGDYLKALLVGGGYALGIVTLHASAKGATLDELDKVLLPGVLIITATWIYSIYDAYTSAKYKNADYEMKKSDLSLAGYISGDTYNLGVIIHL